MEFIKVSVACRTFAPSQLLITDRKFDSACGGGVAPGVGGFMLIGAVTDKSVTLPVRPCPRLTLPKVTQPQW